MSLVLTAAPAAEPVTLADAKMHCRVDSTAEDAFISSLIVTSRLQIEAALSLALITQSWSWRLDAWPDTRQVLLPMRPVQSIESITVAAADGSPTIVASDSYALDGQGVPARLVAKQAPLPPAQIAVQGIEIRFTAGYGDAGTDVPQPLRQAVLLLVAHWFENRQACASQMPGAASIPDEVESLLAPYRIVRL